MESQPSSPLKIGHTHHSTLKEVVPQTDGERLLSTPFGRRNKMRNEAHRGMGLHEPENTLQAFTRACEEQLDGIELDVWLTKDNAVVVIHGHDIDNVEGYIFFDDGSKKLVTEMTLAELRSQTVLNGNIVPLLDEVFRVTKNKVCVNIEFKGTDMRSTEEVLKLCVAHNNLEQVQFSSFDWKFAEALEAARVSLDIQIRPPFGFLTETLDIAESFKIGKQDDGVSFGWDLIEKDMEAFKKVASEVINNGFRVKVYFPFAHQEVYEDYDFLDSVGTDTIITNEPLLVKRYYQKRIN